MKKANLRISFYVVLVWASVSFGEITVDNIIKHGLYSNPQQGNLSGIAYDQSRQQIYLSHGSDSRGGSMHTIDTNGNLLSTWELDPGLGDYVHPTSISYDQQSEHLFIMQWFKMPDSSWENHLVETSVDGQTVFNDFDLTSTNYVQGGDGIYVESDRIWLTSYRNDSITQLSMKGVFVEQFNIGGFSDYGPVDITASFDDGFFLFDLFGSRVVEYDRQGNYLGEVSTEGLVAEWSGRGLAIDSDPISELVYIQLDNYVYVLSGVAESMEYVPEPATLLLLGLGGVMVRRKR